jgi:hypothetical protein
MSPLAEGVCDSRTQDTVGANTPPTGSITATMALATAAHGGTSEPALDALMTAMDISDDEATYRHWMP